MVAVGELGDEFVRVGFFRRLDNFFEGDASYNTVKDNLAVGNGENGFELQTVSYNIVDRNTAHGNGYDGFLVEDFPSRPASYNNLTRNVAYNTSENGFHLYNADNELLEGNTAYGNQGSGFKAEGGYIFTDGTTAIDGPASGNNFTSNAGGSGANELIVGDLARTAGGGAVINFQQNYGWIGQPGNNTSIRYFINNVNGSPLALNDNILGGWAVVRGTNFAAGMTGGLTYLEHYPYECVEQTMSRFLPNLYVAQVMKTYRVATQLYQ